MTHKFDVKNKHKLDNEQRRELLPPEKTLISLGLRSGDIMADIGCGIGYFSIPASEIIGTSGKVFALDISPEMLKEVEKKVMELNISNIKTILTDGNKLELKNFGISFAFVSHVLHEIEDKEKLLEEIKSILVNKGRIAIVEWQKINAEFGPPKEHRLDKADLVKLLEILGFYNISTIDIGESFYGITAEKE